MGRRERSSDVSEQQRVGQPSLTRVTCLKISHEREDTDESRFLYYLLQKMKTLSDYLTFTVS